jgi:hypothetical protein
MNREARYFSREFAVPKGLCRGRRWATSGIARMAGRDYT